METTKTVETTTDKKTINDAIVDLIDTALCYQTGSVQHKETPAYLYMTRLQIAEILEQISESIDGGDYTIKGWMSLPYDDQEKIVVNVANYNGYTTFDNKYPVEYHGERMPAHFGGLLILAIDPEFKKYCFKR